MAHYGTRTNPFSYANYTPPGNSTEIYPIYFGRRLWDPALALDPTKFTNLQLKMQHNLALGSCLPVAGTLEVWADYFDEMPPSPTGYLSAQSLWAKTYVAATHDYPTLPTDAPIRFIYVAAASDVEEPDINISNVKITENGGKRIIYDVGGLTHIQTVESLWPQFEEYFEGRLEANADRTFYFEAQKNLDVRQIGSQDTDSIIHQAWSGGGIRVINGSLLTTITGMAQGQCPAGVIPFPMGDPDDMTSWWDVKPAKNPQIDILTGAGSVAAQYELLLEQLKNY